MKTNRTLMTLIFMIWICEYLLNLCHLRSIVQ